MAKAKPRRSSIRQKSMQNAPRPILIIGVDPQLDPSVVLGITHRAVISHPKLVTKTTKSLLQ